MLRAPLRNRGSQTRRWRKRDPNRRSLPSTGMRHWTLLLPHRQKLLRLPCRRGSGLFPEAHRGYLRSLRQDTPHRRSGRHFRR